MGEVTSGDGIESAVNDVIGSCTAGRVEAGKIPHALGDFMIGARRVAANAKPSNDVTVSVERHAAAEEDQAAGNLVDSAVCPRRREEAGIEQVRLSEAPQRVSRLCERIEPRRR